MQRLFLVVALALLGAATAAALWQHGYWGILAPHFQSWGGAQVLLDLVIALGLVLTWLWNDARTSGRNPWPWIGITLVAGSFGPLLYLLTRRQAGD
ncbi:MAG: DUF2834 domain-containing protein [Burkholderiaceae bacterium]|jgi:hypothetical protein|nr:MAG: DUF2834 domain-containing protein [Burkholderiaceae bacterium]